MDKKIELKVENISNSQAQVPAFALILKEVDGERHLPIIIGPAEAQAITFKINDIKPVRPLTHDLFASTLIIFDITLTEVLIYKAQEGIFYSHIFFRRDENVIRIDSRTSDAIALALRFSCPIYILESILEAEAILLEEEYAEQEDQYTENILMAKDVRTLEKALEKAIKEENYELASVLRDEIARRK